MTKSNQGEKKNQTTALNPFDFLGFVEIRFVFTNGDLPSAQLSGDFPTGSSLPTATMRRRRW